MAARAPSEFYSPQSFARHPTPSSDSFYNMAGGVEDVYPTLGIVQLELKRNLHLMSVKQLKDKLRQNGCRFPSKAGKEQLVNICVEILSTEHSPLDCDPDDFATDEEFDEIDIETEIRGIEQGHITAGTRSS